MITGRIAFSAYMEEALYGENGYYIRPHTRFGRAGDFYTSAQVSPLFGELWAHYIANHTHTEEYRLIELGPGDGHFAVSVLRELLRIGDRPVRYAGVEVSPTGRERIVNKLAEVQSEFADRKLWTIVVSDVTALSADTGDSFHNGFVFANEWLDAIPCDLLRVWQDGKTEQLWVWSRDESEPTMAESSSGPFQGRRYVTEWLANVDSYLRQDAEQRLLPLCIEGEVSYLVAESVWQFQNPILSLLKELEPSVLALVDYGGYTPDIVGADRPEGSLRAFKKHQIINDFIDQPGEVDLTYDVDFEVVKALLTEHGYLVEVKKQGDFLVRQTFFEQVVSARAQVDPNIYQTMKTLILPGGMGDRFLVLTAERR